MCRVRIYRKRRKVDDDKKTNGSLNDTGHGSAFDGLRQRSGAPENDLVRQRYSRSGGESAGNADGESRRQDIGGLLFGHRTDEDGSRSHCRGHAGALFELVPQQPYTEADLDYNNKDSRVSREHEDAAGRHVALVKDTPDNFAVYDTVFIGYPIWWGSAAWPVDDFVKHNDFSGKMVIPFATSHSSPLGASGRNLAAMAGTGTWQEGECFDRSMTKEKVTDWVKSLK